VPTHPSSNPPKPGQPVTSGADHGQTTTAIGHAFPNPVNGSTSLELVRLEGLMSWQWRSILKSKQKQWIKKSLYAAPPQPR